MALTDLSSWTGLLCSVTLVLLNLKRKRAFEIGDVGPTVLVFLAGTNLLPALYLIYFGATPSLYRLLPQQLDGFGKYLVAAGICSSAVSLITIEASLRQAWKG
jgi:ABC-type arginine/histidine transport system permease subunit